MAAITFTLDVEDYTPPGEEPRALDTTLRILDFLAARAVRGTFFLVGGLAAGQPALVRAIADAGHEVASHGLRHDPLTAYEPHTLQRDVGDAKKLLEDLAGCEVVGFRAPAFSLVPESEWASDVLAELGFAYSSSVLPARSPLYGWPGRPRAPHRWPSGLLELPCPVTTVGRIANPYLGGVYFRVLPWPAIEYGLRRARVDELLWIYCHPYDFDPGEPFTPRPDLGRYKSRLQWLNRRRMFDRLGRLLDLGAAPPLRERAAALTI